MITCLMVISSCNDKYDNVAPGNYVNTDRIETFPGDTVLVKGTISNNSPITTISLTCLEWNINHVYERTSYNDNVFNYEYKLIVPNDAKFNQTLTHESFRTSPKLIGKFQGNFDH